MDKIWLQSYPPGVPAEIDPGQLRSLRELVEKTCAEHAERVAYVQMGTEITYGQVDELSRAFALDGLLSFSPVPARPGRSRLSWRPPSGAGC